MRRTTVVVLSLVGVTGVFAVLGVRACIRAESFEYAFSTWTEAVASGQTGEGKWIPSDLPAAATEIKAIYAVDAPGAQVAFRLASSDQSQIPARCEQVAHRDVTFPRPSARWWPQALSASAPPRPDVRYYRCGIGEFLAIRDGHGYFWRL